MNGASINDEIFVLVVGRGSEDLGAEAASLFERFGIERLFCENVYQAVSELAGETLKGKKVIVVGDVGELSREGQRFFEICAERGDCCCCCFFDGGKSKQRHSMLGAIQSGVFFARNAIELERMMEQILASLTSGTEISKRTIQSKHVNRREGVLEQGELDALLGSE